MPSLLAAFRQAACSYGTQSPNRTSTWVAILNYAPRLLRGPWLTVSGVSLLAGAFLTSRLRPSFLPSLPEDRYQVLESTEEEYKLPPSLPLGLLQQLRVFGRLLFLTALFFPAGVIAALATFLDNHFLYDLAWKYTLGAVQVAGPAFIKLAQWASTRRDLFSAECCSVLSKLLTSCDPHEWSETAKILERNLGHDWTETFVFTDHEPIGSGCVAQVYKGYLNLDSLVIARNPEVATIAKMKPTYVVLGKRCVPVAIKVLHPGMVGAMERDICLMRSVASWADYLYPNFHWICLIECVDEFSKSMQKQLDMRIEGSNLHRFQQLLWQYKSKVCFPTPLLSCSTKEVLVETFEEGKHISAFMTNPGGALQKDLAKIGVEVLLDMLFIHNFVHGDLHPGNILVQDEVGDKASPKLVLLDCGITNSLTKADLENFKKTFLYIVQNQGDKVADLFTAKCSCEDIDAYRKEMAVLVDDALGNLNLHQTQIGLLFSKLFDLMIQYKVRLDPAYSSVMIAVMVVEGLGRSLDPSLDILSIAKPCLIQAAKEAWKRNMASWANL
ncbi:hypothetical protein EMCRGX_G034033 [Ephydatia muelleri]